MALFKCKMCGGTLDIQQGSTVAECEYCGAAQTLPKIDDEKRATLYDRANHFRRSNEFDKATTIYEQILNEDNTDAEAYWSLVLCRYGIEYVEDPLTHKRVPTVNRAQFTSIFDDDNYKSALKHSDSYQRILYEEEARAINEIQKGILAISQQEEPFDVFICYKESDANGKRTHDSVLAQDLYYQLTQEGFKVFFARITLEDKLGSAYEPYIFAALNSAKVMVVLGTKPEYFNAVWVRNEWSRFLALIKHGEKKMLIPAYKDMDPYDLPQEFSHLQAQDMSKLGFMQDLIRGIKKILEKDKKVAPAVTERVVVQSEGHDTAPILRRAFLFLEDGNYNSADEYAEKVLDINPECAEAYIVKLMVELKLKRPADLAKNKDVLTGLSNFQKAVRFASPEYRETIAGYNNAIIQRLDTERKNELYNQGLSMMRTQHYSEAIQSFQKISSYKDAAQKIEECKQRMETARLDSIYAQAMQLMNTGKFDEAAKRFGSIPEYKDAKQKVELCAEKKETARKDAIYSKAIQRVQTKDANDAAIKQSIEELHTISGYRDVDDRIRALNVRLDKWYQDKELAEEQARERAEAERRTREREAELKRIKKAKAKRTAKLVTAITVPSVITIAVILVLLFTLIIPAIRFSQADKLINAGDYAGAMEIYGDLNGFSDSEQRIAVINGIDQIQANSFADGINTMLAAGVPVKLTYGMDGGDFSGKEHISLPGMLYLSNSEGSASDSVEFTYNTSADFTGIHTPGRNGYRFVEWKLETYSYQTEGTFELKLTAVWSTKDYTVDYDLAGGEISSDNVAEYDPEDGAFTLINPTRTGYTFAGWIGTDLSEPTINVTIPTGSYGNRTYTATWTANEYTVTYDAAGGTVSSATQTVAYDSNVEYLIPERAGYTFLGWYENTTKHENEKWTRTSDLALVAKWEIIGYTIGYEMNGGKNHGENPTSYKVDTDTITLKDPSLTGYTFTGWTYEGQTTPTKNVTIEKGSVGNKTFTANWEAITTTITFNANSGVCGTTELSATYDQEFTLPEVTRSGYTFLGWFNNETKYESGTWKNYTNMELTAEWEIISYSITYELAGGMNAVGNPETYTVEQTVILELPTRTGYTFLGWTYEGQTTPTKDVTIAQGSTGDKTYTANWEAISSTIALNPNGGACDPVTIPVTYDKEFTLPDCVWAGHTFSGWYLGDTKVVSGVCKFDKDTTLVAEWDVIQYTISYTLNGGTNDPINPNSYNYHDTITLAEPTRVGYTFVGWTFAGQNTPTKEVTIVVGTTGNKAYTANWRANTYTITFNANSGSVTTPTLEATFDTNTVLPTPTRTGYRFDGWFNGTTQYTTGTWKHDGDITLTAKWTANSYKASYNADGGTVSNSYKNYTFDASYTLLTPTRTGYEFLGWYNGDKLVPQSGVWTFDSDISLKAKWQVKTYTVTFDAGVGTSSMPSAQATYDSNFTLATAERVGYTFDGWYYNGTKYSSGAWKTDASITLTAKWTARKDIAYVVNHHQQNANDNGYTIVSTENLEGTADATITPSVKTFTHFISPTAQTVTIAPNGSLVVDYYYDRVTYDLTYVTNGGETIEKQTYKYDQTLVIATPTRAGYTFGGWFNDKNLQNAYSATATLNADTTIYAYWTEENKPSDFNYSGSSAINIDSYIGSDTTVVVPHYIGGKKVTTISSNAFANNTSITSVIFPDSMNGIGSGVFAGCSSLEEIKLPLSVGGGDSVPYTVQNSTTNPWAIDSNGVLYSTNKANSASSTYTIVAVRNETIVIQYKASSESNCDKLTIYKNGVEIAQASGEETSFKTLSIALEVGDKVTFTYSKDSSVAKGADCGYIKGIDYALTLGHLFGESNYEGAVEVVQNTKTYYIPDSLRKVILTSNVITDYAFANCAMLEEIEIPSTVTTIGKYAFSGCISVKKLGSAIEGELIVPEYVTTIGDYTFQDLANISTVVVHDGVTSIGKGAFEGCSALENITLPFVGKTATATGSSGVFGYIFDYNESSSSGGVQQYSYYNNGTRYCYYFIPRTIRHITITAQEAIPIYAFKNCDFVETITVSGTTTSIAESAFYNCAALEKVTLPDTVESIGQYAFYGCSSLNTMNSDVDGVVNLPNALTLINEYAFQNCAAIETLIIPSNVTKISGYAFSGCISITKVNSDVEGELNIPSNVTSIGSDAFKGLVGITKIYVPDTVTSIVSGAFKECTSVEEITVPFINITDTYTLNALFYGSDQKNEKVPATLRKVTITEQTVFGDYAFRGCKSIEEINIPASTTSIGKYAFYECSSLTRLNSNVDGVFNVPSGVTIIDEYAFEKCLLVEKVNLGNEVTSIKYAAFRGCSMLSSFTIPQTVTTIGHYAFDGCMSITRINSDTEGEMVIPSNVTSIGDGAFTGLASITKVTVPDSVKTVGNSAFKNCTSIEEMTLPYVNNSISDTDRFSILFGASSDNSYVPKSIKKVTITKQTAIPAYAFYKCEKIEEINIPANTATIGENAFAYCTLLARLNSNVDGVVNIPAEITEIKSTTFYSCISIEKVFLGEVVNKIDTGAFSTCTALNQFNSSVEGELIIPESVRTIATTAFEGLPLITKIVVPDSVSAINSNAFKNCNGVEEVVVPFVGIKDGDTGSSSKLFSAIFYSGSDIPKSIKKVTITSQSVIPDNAFKNCKYLETIILPTNATLAGSNCFYNCPATVSYTYNPSVSIWKGSEVSASFLGNGTSAEPYQINSAADLAYLASSVNAGESYAGKHFVLNININLNTKSWTPIGTKSNPFEGTFDGNGKKIYNLSVTMDTAYAGLFGYVSGTVKNLGVFSGTLAPASKAGTTYVGPLVAYLTGTVENCYSQAAVSTSITNIVYAGGLVGHVDSAATVKDSYASGHISAVSSSGFAYAGGLVGANKGTVDGCLAFGNVTAKGTNDTYSRNGGLVANNSGTLTECYRSETQKLVQYTTTGSAYCEDGTVDSYSNMIAYAQTNWASTVWEFDLKYPSHK